MHPNLSAINDLTRRTFIKTTAVGVGVAGLAQLADSAPVTRSSLRVAHGDVILFQGDSITDTGRSREKEGAANEQAGLGNGYASIAAAALLLDHPKADLRIFNRGISGNKVFQLSERWEKDCLSLKPNLLSILIGVNDIWHTLNGNYQGTAEIYERDYRALLERTRQTLPKVKLVICEPFVLRCGAVGDKWFPEFDHYRAAAKRVADHFHATFVPFQGMFNEAVKYAPPEHWAKDGVHPSSAGAALMAHAWLRKVES
jgi:lysophospholipase L1-like esterase